MSSQQGPNAVNLRWEAAQKRKEWKKEDAAMRIEERPVVRELFGLRNGEPGAYNLGCYYEADLEDAKAKWAAKGFGAFEERPPVKRLGFFPAS